MTNCGGHNTTGPGAGNSAIYINPELNHLKKKPHYTASAQTDTLPARLNEGFGQILTPMYFCVLSGGRVRICHGLMHLMHLMPWRARPTNLG